MLRNRLLQYGRWSFPSRCSLIYFLLTHKLAPPMMSHSTNYSVVTTPRSAVGNLELVYRRNKAAGSFSLIIRFLSSKSLDNLLHVTRRCAVCSIFHSIHFSASLDTRSGALWNPPSPSSLRQYHVHNSGARLAVDNLLGIGGSPTSLLLEHSQYHQHRGRVAPRRKRWVADQFYPLFTN